MTLLAYEDSLEVSLPVVERDIGLAHILLSIFASDWPNTASCLIRQREDMGVSFGEAEAC